MLVMISGEAVLVEDDGRQAMRAGDIAVWPKGSTNGHHLINESDADCVFVALGGGKAHDTGGGYSDIDMLFAPAGYFHKDGPPYPTSRIPCSADPPPLGRGFRPSLFEGPVGGFPPNPGGVL